MKFTTRLPITTMLGPILWISSLQYFLLQIVVASAWELPFSITHNTISDLGNTVCGPYGTMAVCSPLHTVMNISFIVLGITMAGGIVCLQRVLPKTVASQIGFGCLMVSAFGTSLVGIFPENTLATLHILGASGPFLVGNIGLIILGLSLSLSPKFKGYTVASGVVALTALVLFISGNYLGLGNGGMERITAYPQTIWLIVTGLFILRGGLPLGRAFKKANS